MMTKPTHEYLKASLGLYIKNHKGPGLSQETWTINEGGKTPLSSILVVACECIINMALRFMPSDEVIAEAKQAAKQLATIEVLDSSNTKDVL
jgi:hypothetical protein